MLGRLLSSGTLALTTHGTVGAVMSFGLTDLPSAGTLSPLYREVLEVGDASSAGASVIKRKR